MKDKIKNVESYVEAIKELDCKILHFEGIALFDFLDITKEIKKKLNGYREISISIVTRKDAVDAFQISVE